MGKIGCWTWFIPYDVWDVCPDSCGFCPLHPPDRAHPSKILKKNCTTCETHCNDIMSDWKHGDPRDKCQADPQCLLDAPPTGRAPFEDDFFCKCKGKPYGDRIYKSGEPKGKDYYFWCDHEEYS